MVGHQLEHTFRSEMDNREKSFLLFPSMREANKKQKLFITQNKQLKVLAPELRLTFRRQIVTDHVVALGKLDKAEVTFPDEVESVSGNLIT